MKPDFRHIKIPHNKNSEIILCDLLSLLLHKDPSMRPKSVREVKNHPWFSTINWVKISQKVYKAPFIPRDILRHRYIKENNRQPDSELDYIYDVRFFTPHQTRKDTDKMQNMVSRLQDKKTYRTKQSRLAQMMGKD